VRAGTIVARICPAHCERADHGRGRARSCSRSLGRWHSRSGYAPTSWGWSAFALVWLVGLVLVLGIQARLGVLELAELLGLTGILVWTPRSSFWKHIRRRSVVGV